MSDPSKVVVKVEVKVKNQKAIRALNVLLRNLESIYEDFEYRDDMKQAVKAANYLTNNLTIVGAADQESPFCEFEHE